MTSGAGTDLLGPADGGRSTLQGSRGEGARCAQPPSPPPGLLFAARAVLAWSRGQSKLPRHPRAFANAAGARFLVDHGRPGATKRRFLAACGNRMKARNHARGQQQD